MGLLILTKGTRRLVRKLNREFRPANMAFYRVAARKIWFDTPQTTRPEYLLDVVNHFNLIPVNHPQHPNLGAKWLTFLQHDLNHVWHDAIRQAISVALNDPACTRILFDAVQSTSQQVLADFEFDSPAADPDDQTDVDKYMKIVLVTPRARFWLAANLNKAKKTKKASKK